MIMRRARAGCVRFLSAILLLDIFGELAWSFPMQSPGSGNRLAPEHGLYERRRRQEVDYYDRYEYNDEDQEEGADDYWSSVAKEEQKEQKEQRGGVYKVYFDGNVDPKETQLDWEVCSDGTTEALVLLPPEAAERPTAIVHFVGGTFFGSTPKLWYRTFLEGLVRNTQCAIIITPIPVTLLKSPLQHTSLSQKLGRAFENAWNVILEDEYGDLSDVPVCGIGHSLGARLLVVLATLNQNKPKGPVPIPPYKSFALISFTNYGASAGIPGVSTLLRQSKKQEQVTTVTGERQRRKTAQRARQDWWIDDEYNDDVDEDWVELVDDIQELIQEQATRVKTALTPKSEDLEFFPTPDMLWKAVKEDQRYCVPETLVVQFDDDPIDQSSKLAQILQETNSSDVKFARLRGTHLTPISISEGDTAGGWLELTSKASKTVWKAIRGRSKTKVQEAAMRDLRQSIARYITDVVTK
jgi:hypothetical protein